MVPQWSMIAGSFVGRFRKSATVDLVLFKTRALWHAIGIICI